MNRNIIAASILIIASAINARADIQLPDILSDHMVLPQNTTAKIWGSAEPGENVTINSSWPDAPTLATVTDSNGHWNFDIKTPPAGGPYSMSLKGNNELTINDILIGELWLASGQSNMGWTMTYVVDAKTEIADANFPDIRIFKVAYDYSSKPTKQCKGSWLICNPQNAGQFSAVAYYFAQKLHLQLDFPVGIIQSEWGGTIIEAWMSKEALSPFPQYNETISKQQLMDIDYAANQKALETYKNTTLAKWEKDLEQFDKGIAQNWNSPDFNDSDWHTIELPQLWDNTELKDFDGIIWFRRNASLNAPIGDRTIRLFMGFIDGIDTTWVNKVKFGTTQGTNTFRYYYTPFPKTDEQNVTIAARIVDIKNKGGFYVPNNNFQIGFADEPLINAVSLAGPWKYKISYTGSHLPTLEEPVLDITQNSPTALFNAMIKPLTPLAISGAIWYQGESNSTEPLLYRKLFPAMIQDWRKQWKNKDLPFYFVQIAPFEYAEPIWKSYALREAQLMTLSLPHTGMAVTLDIGEQYSIHPMRKKEVGYRLASWALAKDYGQNDTVFSGPIYKNMKIQGDKIRLYFEHTDGGLMAKGDQLNDFTIAGPDKLFHPAKATIDGDTILVFSDEVAQPQAARYGWSNWVDATLFNKAGLPASSFRTDDWPLE